MTRKHRSKMFRTVAQRIEKWDKKLNAKDYSIFLERTKPIAIDNFAEYQAIHESLISLVRNILSKFGSESQKMQAYMWYAQGVWYCVSRYKNEALRREVNALFIYFKLLGLNEIALREIACSLSICPDPVEKILSDLNIQHSGEITSTAVYEGTKKAIEETIYKVLKDSDVYTNPVDIKINYNENGDPIEIIVVDKVTNDSRKLNIKYNEQGLIEELSES